MHALRRRGGSSPCSVGSGGACPCGTRGRAAARRRRRHAAVPCRPVAIQQVMEAVAVCNRTPYPPSTIAVGRRTSSSSRSIVAKVASGAIEMSSRRTQALTCCWPLPACAARISGLLTMATLTVAVRHDHGYTYCGYTYCGYTYCGYTYWGYTYCGYTCHCPPAPRGSGRGT
jgi:hypothetical protein